MARVSYKKMAIEQLSNIMGISYENAEKLQRRLYRQVLRQYGDVRPFKTTRELYYSLINESTGAIKFEDDLMSIDKSKKQSATEILSTRMKRFIRQTGGKKGEIGILIKQLESGKIDYKTFKESVKKYKRTAEYKSRQKESITE